VRTWHLSSRRLLFERWKTKRAIIGGWRADAEFQRNYPGYSWLWNHVMRPVILFTKRRMT